MGTNGCEATCPGVADGTCDACSDASTCTAVTCTANFFNNDNDFNNGCEVFVPAPVPAPPPFTWAPPPPPPSQQEPTIPSDQQGDQESTPVTTPPLPPTTKPPTPSTDEQQQEGGQQEEDLVPLVTVVPQILAAASIPLGTTTMVVTFTSNFRPEAISPGYVATLTDASGNTATLVVKSVSADGTIEFETAVKCKEGVECDFLSDTTIDFSEGPETTTLFQKSAGVVQQVDKTGAPEAGGGHEHDHDHDGDGVQDHAGKNGGTQQAKSAKSTGKGGGEGSKKGTKGKGNGVASGEGAGKGTKGKGNGVASAMFATEHASVGKQGALTTAVFAATAVVCVAVAAIIVRKVREKNSGYEYENLEKEFVDGAEGPSITSPTRVRMYKHSAKYSTAGN